MVKTENEKMSMGGSTVGARGFSPGSTMYTPMNVNGIATTLEGKFRAHAGLVWVGMPILAATELLPFLGATCKTGYPDYTLLFFIAIELHRLYCESVAWKRVKELLSEPERAVMRRFGVFRNRKWRVIQGLLESLDLYTDLCFPFIAKACGEGPLRDITGIAQQSWHLVPVVGHPIAMLMGKVRFWGVCFIVSALNIIVTGYIGFFRIHLHEKTRKQTLKNDPELYHSSLSGEVFFGWAMSAETAMMPSVANLCEEMANQKRFTFDVTKDAAEAMEARVAATLGRGMGHAKDLEMNNEKERSRVEAARKQHYVSMLVMKVLVGNVLLLWIQASFYAITYEYFSDEARWKLIVSMVISVLQAAIRCISVTAKLPGPGLGLSVCIMGVVLVALAKVYFAGQCKSHVWNLTSGCVDLDVTKLSTHLANLTLAKL